MQRSRLERSLALAGRGPFLKPDGTEGGSEGKQGDGSDAKAETAGDDQKSSKSDGEKGDDKEALKRMGEQRDAARSEAKKAQEERDALLKEKQDREAAEAKAKEEDAAKRGEFEALAKKREDERDAAKAESTTLKAENDQLRAAMAEGIAAGWKELPEEVRKVGEKQHAEDDVLGRWTFLNDPDTKALVSKLADKSDTKRGNGYPPKNSGDSQRTVEQEAAALRARGGYSM